MYRFDGESPAFGGTLGACHAVELPYVFGNHRIAGAEQFVGTGPEVDALAERTMDAWLAFARSGEPCHAGLPAWPAYDEKRRATMLLGPTCTLAESSADAERSLWDGLI